MNVIETLDISNNKLETPNNTNDISNNVWTKRHFEIIKYVCSNTSLNEEQATKGLIQYKGDYNKVIQIATMYHLIGIVMRQTTYTFNEAAIKLQQYKGEPVSVIKEFMGTLDHKKKTVIAKTTNQKLFYEIRTFKDDVNKGYDNRKTQTERIQKLQDAYNKNQ